MSYGPTATKIGHGLAKGLGIKLQYRNETGRGEKADKIARGESIFSVNTADSYVEDEPTSLEWILEQLPSGKDWVEYFKGLLPFTHWILRYNFQWFIGDLIAGVTIGAVVVPQGMAYAQLATLPPQFGLYSAFMGVLIYWFFATSKDITIGPVAVMSTITGNVIEQVKGNPSLAEFRDTPWVIAQDLAIICGAIIAFIGIVRLGWIVDFISLTAVTAFITGSAFYIAVGQVPALLGISSKYVNNRDAGYVIVINTLKHLDKAKLDAALGLTGLLLLYSLKYGFAWASKKFPQYRKPLFFATTLRTVFVILLYTLIGWLVNMHHHNSKQWKFQLLGTVPRGFKDAGAPKINTSIISGFASQIPVSVIVLLIEHISIAKSFGRINNYTINPSQELLAIGVTNLLGPLVGAYPATGSFTRTAIKSKAGVRTPLAGVITAIVVLLAIYALPAVFYYIPKATLSAVIMHAVLDLIAPANAIYQFWRISPLEVIIFLIGVFVTVFASIEIGVYTTVIVSAALLLWRVAKAQGRFLGKATVHSVVGDDVLSDRIDKSEDDKLRSAVGESHKTSNVLSRDVYLPYDHGDGSNPDLALVAPYPGVFVYRFSEGFNYPNASHYLDFMVQTLFKSTRRTDPFTFTKPGDRPWNDPGPKKGEEDNVEWTKPTLKAVILDFSSVNNVDVTSVQSLIDVRNQLDRYTKPEVVEWHFACINNRWTKRALTAAGFGYPTPTDDAGEFHRWKPVFSVAEIGGDTSAAAAAELDENTRSKAPVDIESKGEIDKRDYGYAEDLNKSGVRPAKIGVVHGLNRPNFHVDVISAVHSAVSNIKNKSPEGSRSASKAVGKDYEVREESASDS